VAVFGDAANDVPMFRAVGGISPALRVAMPHATHPELCELSNARAEVSTVLERLCEARRSRRASRSAWRAALCEVEAATGWRWPRLTSE